MREITKARVLKLRATAPYKPKAFLYWGEQDPAIGLNSLAEGRDAKDNDLLPMGGYL